MALQGGLNSALGKIIGLLEATFIVHASAAVVVGVMVFALGMGDGGFIRAGEAPWYFYIGGVIGVAITYGVVASIPRLGAGVATTAIIVGQVSTALLIDHFGLFGLQRMPFTWMQWVGLGLMAAGARMMLR